MRKKNKTKLSPHYRFRAENKKTNRGAEGFHPASSSASFRANRQVVSNQGSANQVLSASSKYKCSPPSATRSFSDEACEAVRRYNQAESDARILSDDLSWLPSRNTRVHCDGVRLSCWGPLGSEWSHISFNHPLQGRDVMLLICFLLLPSDTLSGVLAGVDFFLCHLEFPVKVQLFWVCCCFFLLLSGCCYICCNHSDSFPCDADSQGHKIVQPASHRLH